MRIFKGKSIYFMVSLASAIVVVPLATYLSRVPVGGSLSTRSLWAIVLVGTLYVVVQRFAVQINIAQLNRNYVVTEVPMVLGAALLHPLVHVIARFLAAAVGTAWRVRHKPGISTTKAAFANGLSGSAEAAAFSAVLIALRWQRTYDVHGTWLICLGWLAATGVGLAIPNLGNLLVGDHRISIGDTRNAIVNTVSLSLPAMMISILLVRDGSFMPTVLLFVPAAIIGRHVKPILRQLAEGDTYKARHEFSRLLQKTTSGNVERALELAANATKTRTAQIVILEREGIDRQLDSALTITSAGRSTKPSAELPPDWRAVLESSITATHGAETPATASIICPLIVADHAVGLLVCAEPFDVVRGITPEIHETAESLAYNLSLWLEQDRLLGELRRDMETRTQQAIRDPLTGLLNRRGFSEAWDTHVKDQDAVAVFLVDLDSFKETNSYVGHDGGDQVLIEAARRMSSVLPNRAHIARIGGDEFAAFLPTLRKGKGDFADCGELGAELRACLASSFFVNNLEVSVAGSIGIAVSPHHGTDLRLLMRNADAALFSAKDESGVAVFANASYGHDSSTNRDIDGYRLKAAIENHEIECWFMPIVDMQTFRVAGFEALARWKDRGRIVMPQEFIPLAEKTGHIHALTTSLISQAITNTHVWTEHFGRKFDVGINMSPMSVANPATYEALVDALTATGLDPGVVFLEVTESRMFKDPMRATVHLNHLRKTGVKISLDDFGTGASTHEWLFRMKPDQIKIDRMFVKDMCVDERAAGIVELDVQTGLKFNAAVVAEGIETVAHWHAARALGVPLAQGYLLGRPKPASEIKDWLTHEEPRLEQLILLADSLDPIPTSR
jgi:diguanylate cyclase (GGDEF)-like protein